MVIYYMPFTDII